MPYQLFVVAGATALVESLFFLFFTEGVHIDLGRIEDISIEL
jgi:hypothetical protein